MALIKVSKMLERMEERKKIKSNYRIEFGFVVLGVVYVIACIIVNFKTI